MALYQSKQIASKLPLTESDGAGDVVCYYGEFLVPTGLAINDVIELTGVPANHVPTKVEIFTDQVDSNGSPTMTFDWGYISGIYGDTVNVRTCGQDFGAALTAPVRVGGNAVPAAANTGIGRSVATSADRGIGIKVAAAIATPVINARIRMRVEYIANPGDLT